MVETEAAGWRVPCDAVHYVVVGLLLTVQFGALFAIDQFGQDRWVPASLWGLLTALFLTFGAWFDDRPIRAAVQGRSDAERSAVQHSLRTGLLPPDGSFDAYVGWTIQIVRQKWRILRRLQPWLSVLIAGVGLAVAVVTGEPSWLLFAMVSAGLAVIIRWDLARMDDCFADLERQIAARQSA
jgi:hypothetical protein